MTHLGASILLTLAGILTKLEHMNNSLSSNTDSDFG